MTASTTYVVKKHHMHWGVLIVFLVVLGLAVAVAWLAGGGVHEENGQYVITKPSMDTLRSRVVVRDQQGHLQAVPAPNGKTVDDGFGADGKLQRSETERYDPIDKLTSAVNANSDAMKASSEATNKSISDLKDEVSTSFKKVNDRVDGLGTQIATVDGKVKGLTGKVEAEHNSIDSLTKRVTTLEANGEGMQPPKSAPSPAPEFRAPMHRHVSEASAPQSTSRVADSEFVTPHNASRSEMRMMLQAYRDLGAAPGGSKISGFRELPHGQGFTCPDGSAGVLVSSRRDNGGLARRWKCH